MAAQTNDASPSAGKEEYAGLFSDSLATPEEKVKIATILKDSEGALAGMACVNFPEVTGEINVLRFLRGNEGDVAKATTFFQKMLQWRKDKNVDAIRQRVYDSWQKAGGRTEDLKTHTYLPHADIVLKHYPERFFHKEDKQRNPVKITRQPFINDFPGLMASLKPEQYYEYRLARGELRALLLQNLSVEQNRMARVTLIWDLQGMELAYWTLLRSKEGQAYSGDYEDTAKDSYPEVIHQIIVVNTPWFMNMLWKAAKGLLPARTVAKIFVYSSNFVQELSERIDIKSIPEVLGGQCKCEDKDGCFPTNWQTVQVAAGSKQEFEYELTTQSSFVWEFRSKGHDIAFAATFRGASEVPVVPHSRPDSAAITRGQFRPPSNGKLVLTFDNSFSWMRGKTVDYNFQHQTISVEGDKTALAQLGLTSDGAAVSPSASADVGAVTDDLSSFLLG